MIETSVNLGAAENSRILRLTSELVDLRMANANPYSKCKHFECARCEYGIGKKRSTPDGVLLFW